MRFSSKMLEPGVTIWFIADPTVRSGGLSRAKG